MADVSKIFKPRRGKLSTMLGTKASTVLAAGEMFFEVPDTGVGTGRGRIMIGDGSSTYVTLAGANNNYGANSQAAKYFMPFAQDEIITHPGTDTKTVSASSSIQSTAVATNLNNAKSGAALKTIIHNLREAIYKNACDIAKLNNDPYNKYRTISYTSYTNETLGSGLINIGKKFNDITYKTVLFSRLSISGLITFLPNLNILYDNSSLNTNVYEFFDVHTVGTFTSFALDHAAIDNSTNTSFFKRVTFNNNSTISVTDRSTTTDISRTYSLQYIIIRE